MRGVVSGGVGTGILEPKTMESNINFRVKIVNVACFKAIIGLSCLCYFIFKLYVKRIQLGDGKRIGEAMDRVLFSVTNSVKLLGDSARRVDPAMRSNSSLPSNLLLWHGYSGRYSYSSQSVRRNRSSFPPRFYIKAMLHNLGSAIPSHNQRCSRDPRPCNSISANCSPLLILIDAHRLQFYVKKIVSTIRFISSNYFRQP